MMKAIITGVITMGGLTDYQYINGLMLSKYGTLSNFLPNCHFILKASKNMDHKLQHLQKICKEYIRSISRDPRIRRDPP